MAPKSSQTVAERSNVSADLIWSLVRSNNAYLVKRRSGGGVQFSRDPLNLTNKHTRTHAGFVNDKAVGLEHTENGIKLVSKKPGSQNKPASSLTEVNYGKNRSSRKIFKSTATHANGYRSDLVPAAVKRGSALKLSQKTKKDAPAKKLRGAKANKVEA